ncbi:hypothetical protein HJ590_06565 [Naumannella sp. ID2617S]|nr:hypothetical protein [Naumannella sp. ID2617S]
MTEPTEDQPRPARALSPARSAGSPVSPDTTVFSANVLPRHAADPAADAGADSGADSGAEDGPVADRASEPVAWQDPATRKLANRRLLLPIVALLLGLLVAAGCVALVLLGGMERVWGLPAVVVGAGLAGGCLTGGVFGLIGWSRLRRTLQAAPWLPGELEVEVGNRARLLADGGVPGLLELETRADRLGERGARVPVEVVRDGVRVVLAAQQRGRLVRTWPVAARGTEAVDDRS